MLQSVETLLVNWGHNVSYDDAIVAGFFSVVRMRTGYDLDWGSLLLLRRRCWLIDDWGHNLRGSICNNHRLLCNRREVGLLSHRRGRLTLRSGNEVCILHVCHLPHRRLVLLLCVGVELGNRVSLHRRVEV